MSSINTVQLSSIPFHPEYAFPSGMQQLGATTNFNGLPANNAVPVTILGSGTTNPSYVFDNRVKRSTMLLLQFLATATDASNLAIRVTGVTNVVTTSLYSPTLFFNGIGTTENYAVNTLAGKTSSFGIGSFSTKTFASPYVNYIEPADDRTLATLLCDIRGFDLAVIDLAQGSATAALYAQILFGVN